MASDEQFSLCWNNFHANMSAGFHGLLSRGDLVDVTLAAEGRLLQAHKLVLSVCSPYFQEMFKMNPTQHPIVFLKDVSHSALRDLLQFMYQGEVNVKQEELASFISTAEQLQVKGLTGNQNEESSTPSKPKPTSRPGPRSSQQRQIMTKLETDLDSKPSTTPVAVKRPNRPSIASNNSSSSQSGPAKRKCVDPLEAGPSGSAKEEFVTIPDEDENNAVAPKMEPEFVNESMWDDDDDGANNEETNFGEDDSNMEMTGFDGSATGDGNITGGGEGGAVGDAQDSKPKSPENPASNVTTKEPESDSDDDVIEVVRDDAPIEILSDGEELEMEMMKLAEENFQTFNYSSVPLESNINDPINYCSNLGIDHLIDPLTNTETITNNIQNCSNVLRFNNSMIPSLDSTTDIANEDRPNHDDYDDDEENVYVNVTDDVNMNEPTQSDIAMDVHDQNDQVEQNQAPAENSCDTVHNSNDVPGDLTVKPPGDLTVKPPGDLTVKPPGDATVKPPGDLTDNPSENITESKQ